MSMWKRIPFRQITKVEKAKPQRPGAFYARAMPESTVLDGQAAIDDHDATRARRLAAHPTRDGSPRGVARGG